jgi:K+:H+ antiporter
MSMSAIAEAVSPRPRAPSRGRMLLAYAGLVALPLAALIFVLHAGASLAPASQPHAPQAPAPALGLFRLPLLLAQIVVILLFSRGLGMLLGRFRQPQVIADMVAGLLLGHSVLGALWPGAHDLLFPRGSLRFLNALSQIGVLLFMFLVGLDLDRGMLRRQGPAAFLTSHASIAIPMFLGAAMSLSIYPHLASTGVGFTPFALFLGAAMSVTAFPVLARILGERGLQRTEIGTVAIASAAVDDVTAWCILALVAVVARAGEGSIPIWLTLAGLAAHVALMVLLVRPLLSAGARRAIERGGVGTRLVWAVVVTTLASAWVTEVLGVHPLFGAFLAGVVMPKDARFVSGLKQRFEDVMLVLLLPLFFAYTGLRTNTSLLEGGAAWGTCLAITGVAVLGKLGGAAAAARAAGMPWRRAAAVGALMNTRGLMELIILNVGLDLGVITPTLFAMMVIMAILTTLMTAPLVDLLHPVRQRSASAGSPPPSPAPPWWERAPRRRAA